MPEKLTVVPNTKTLKCEFQIAIHEKDQQGRTITYHRKCGKPAALREVAGLMTSAKAVLCDQHAARADWECAISDRGYRLGKIAKEEKGLHAQVRLPGIGVQK